MATYKVPQDVEAEDKLLGPLSFRQFVYAMIAAGGIVMGFFLFQASPPLVAIPLPVVLLFSVLALPLRKDQPMETYLLAVLRFYLKPKMRLWNPDGTITYVEITAPKIVEEHLTKEFTGQTAKERLDYLAEIMDTRGWSLKNLTTVNSNMAPTVAAEAQTAADIMDTNQTLSRTFDQMITKTNEQHRYAAIQNMRAAVATPPPTPAAVVNPPSQPIVTASPTQPVLATQTPAETMPSVHYNPYPEAIHQKVVQPIETPLTTTAINPSPPTGIIETPSNFVVPGGTANNGAALIGSDDEVVINLH
jgi:hypothetical protein